MANKEKPPTGGNITYLLQYSSPHNPCPICGRTKDGDCRIRSDGELVLCHHNFDETCPQGWRYVKPSDDDRTGIFVKDYPKTDRPWGKTFRHPYKSFQGTTHTQIRKYKPDKTGKTCKWDKKLGDIKESDLLPYQWDKVKDSDEIFIVEGELQVDDLIARGISATFIRSWSDNHAELFIGKTVILLPDCDVEGIKKANKAKDLLLSKSVAIRWCYLPRIGNWEHLKPNGGLDSYDYFQLGGTVEELRSAITEDETTTKVNKSSATNSKKDRSTSDQLIDLVIDDPNITLWRTDDDVAYADIFEGNIRRTFPINESSFKGYLKRRYFDLNRKSPNNEALNQAIGTIEAFAVFDGDTHPIYLRVAEHDGRVYYDLGDDTWQVVEISRDGWRLVSDAPVRFRRTKSMLPLPIPADGGSLSQLRELMNLSDEHWVIVGSFLVNALRPCVNYPVLILHGEAGSGKSTLSTLLKRLIDPSKPMLVPSIADLRNLSIYAVNRHLLVYDNLSGISNEQSDALCRISTGGGFSHRKLMTDTEEITLDFVRPQILNGIDALATRGDLLDRSYLVQLHKPDRRVNPSDYWAKFDQVHPQLLGALFTALSQALAVLPTVTIDDLPRMAEYAKLGTALEPSLNLRRGAFMAMHQGIKLESHRTAIDSSPIGTAILQLMENRQKWGGYVSELYTELNNMVKDDALKRSKAWFTNANELGKRITRIAPDLRGLNLDIETERKEKGKWVLIKRMVPDNKPKMSTVSTASTEPLPSKDSNPVERAVETQNLSTGKINPVETAVEAVEMQNLSTAPETAPSKDAVEAVDNVDIFGSLSGEGGDIFNPFPLEDDPDNWEGIE